MQSYKLFDHTADIGMEIFGRTPKELFAYAAEAMLDVMIQDSGSNETSAESEMKTFSVEGRDREDLMANFLREVLYLFNGKGWVAGQCKIMECSTKRLVAQLIGEPFNKKKHSIKTEIKAVTYSGLSIEKVKPGWRARVIFDV
jgi:SHS2 domain-containing protein